MSWICPNWNHMNIDPVLQVSGLRFGYDLGQTLIDIGSFTIQKGESIFLRGPSGSGKSTLLGVIGGVLTPDAGSVSICGKNITEITPGQRDQIRADHLGIIFQQFNLLPYLSVIQNCALPCRFSAIRKQRAINKDGTVMAAAQNLVRDLGLSEEHLTRPVGELSVGQQQRVAVARALIGGPNLIIADEPTSALDHNNRDKFIELLNLQRETFGSSLLFVSHDSSLAAHFDRVESLTDLNEADLNQGVAI